MSKSLHVAKVHPVDNYASSGICGWDSQEAFWDLLKAFNVMASTEDGYDDDYEVLRSDLRKIAGELAFHGAKYKSAERVINKALEAMNMDEEEMISSLMRLVRESDQSNEWVLVSWF